MTVPYQAMGRHQVVIGASGSGKTNLMIRSWAGWYTAALHAARTQGGPRPLLVVLDCKGGPDSRVKAGRARRLLWTGEAIDAETALAWGLVDAVAPPDGLDGEVERFAAAILAGETIAAARGQFGYHTLQRER